MFNDSNDTVRALKTSRVDAIVVDLPTAFYLTAAEVPEAKIVGQFAAPGGDDWGVRAGQGLQAHRLRRTRRSAKLKDSGELQQITDKWMGGQSGAPDAAIADRAPSPPSAGSPARRRGAPRPPPAAIAAVSTVVVLGAARHRRS